MLHCGLCRFVPLRKSSSIVSFISSISRVSSLTLSLVLLSLQCYNICLSAVKYHICLKVLRTKIHVPVLLSFQIDRKRLFAAMRDTLPVTNLSQMHQNTSFWFTIHHRDCLRLYFVLSAHEWIKGQVFCSLMSLPNQ